MRIVSADEAVSSIQSGQQIFMHGAAATPSVLLEALVRRAPELRDVKIVHEPIPVPVRRVTPDNEIRLKVPVCWHRDVVSINK